MSTRTAKKTRETDPVAGQGIFSPPVGAAISESVNIDKEILQIFKDAYNGTLEEFELFDFEPEFFFKLNALSTKKIILNALLDKELSFRKAWFIVRYIECNEANYLAVSSSFFALYCALYPEEWDRHPEKQECQMLEEIARICSPNEENIKLVIEELKTIAHTVVTEFIAKIPEDQKELTVGEKNIRESILSELTKTPLQTNDSKEDTEPMEIPSAGIDAETIFKQHPIAERRHFFKIYLGEFLADYKASTEVSHTTRQAASPAATTASPVTTTASTLSMAIIGIGSKLSRHHPVWKEIYSIIKNKPVGSDLRDEETMRTIVKAISHKEDKGCLWRNLPGRFPPVAKVYYYYQQWQRQGILDKIKAILQESEEDNPQDRPGHILK
jgi:hypothetical protein